MLMDVGARMVDFDFHKVHYKDTEYTVTQMMQMIMNECFKAMTSETSIDCGDSMEAVYDMLKVCHRYLWW